MNNPLKGPNSVWFKIITALTPLIVVGLFGVVKMQARLEELSVDVEKKVDLAIVAESQRAILRELDQVQHKLDELVAQHTRLLLRIR